MAISQNDQNRQKPLINTWTICFFWTPFLKSYSGKRSKLDFFGKMLIYTEIFFSNHPFFTFLSIFEIFRILKCHRRNLKNGNFFFLTKYISRGGKVHNYHFYNLYSIMTAENLFSMSITKQQSHVSRNIHLSSHLLPIHVPRRMHSL